MGTARKPSFFIDETHTEEVLGMYACKMNCTADSCFELFLACRALHLLLLPASKRFVNSEPSGVSELHDTNMVRNSYENVLKRSGFFYNSGEWG